MDANSPIAMENDHAMLKFLGAQWGMLGNYLHLGRQAADKGFENKKSQESEKKRQRGNSA